jgi:glutathione synthase/RimK-type ligase-like ATP-grasp enzyme
MARLEELQVPAFRFDTDRFPTEVRLVHEDGPRGMISRLIDGERSIDLMSVKAVWSRRYEIGGKIPKTMNPKLRAPSIEESRAVVLGLISSLKAFYCDRYAVVRDASHKALQLVIAREVGLDIPATLTTNDPDAVRAFAATYRGRLVAKMLSSFAVYDDDGRENVVFTNDIEDRHLEDLSGLALCPMTFQEKVPKAMELRVTVVGDRVLAASIDSQAVSGAEVDWRRRGAELIDAWKPYDLPADIADRLRELTRRLQLNYGAIDVIVTPDGRHVFLECNPGGEFFWLDRILPISESIADLLAKHARG